MRTIITLLALICCLTTSSASAQLAIKNMYLLSNVDQHTATYSGCWGYVAPDGREYAIIGSYDGTVFIDITDVTNIHQVGFVPSTNPASSNNLWREMKVYSHYAYLVSEVSSSGVQIVDLQYLPDSIHYVKKFVATGHSSTHSISQSGPYLYLNGANSGFVGNKGIAILDLSSNPETPVVRGKWTSAYVHDCRVLNDTIWAANIYVGKMSIINAQNKNTLTTVSQWAEYPQQTISTHNCAITGDRKYILATNEVQSPAGKLRIFNIQDLGNITYVTQWQPTGISNSIVHNVEIYGSNALIAHYTAGIRFVDITNPASPTEVAWYDTYPPNDTNTFDGCWGVYMFPSGKIIGSDMQTGLYVVKMYYNISVALEGYYNSSNNRMNKKDTVRAYLRQYTSPYGIVDSAKATVDSVSLTGNFKMNSAPSGTYYLVLKHRSSIETWSKAGGESYDPMTLETYNFTSSSAQAYGNNIQQVDASPVVFGLYAGDSNQDGIIDVSDIALIFNDAQSFASGYLSTDVDGDNSIDLTDVVLAFNNAFNFVSKITP